MAPLLDSRKTFYDKLSKDGARHARGRPPRDGAEEPHRAGLRACLGGGALEAAHEEPILHAAHADNADAAGFTDVRAFPDGAGPGFRFGTKDNPVKARGARQGKSRSKATPAPGLNPV